MIEDEWPKRVEVTLPNGVKMAFRQIPAGGFRMGQRGGAGIGKNLVRVSRNPELVERREETNGEPVTEVFTREFWMAETAVTQEQFAAWRNGMDYEQWFQENLGKNSWSGMSSESPERHENAHGNQAHYPADSVTWWEGREFGAWLERVGILAEFFEKAGLPEGGSWGFDLPTEAQWENACRAGTETEYWSGDSGADLEEVAWFGEGFDDGSIHPVAGKEANSYGLYDVHGNVWEWCRDDCDLERSTSRLRVPKEAETDILRERGVYPFMAIRGGSSLSEARFCRSACRYHFEPGARRWYFGFRLALVPRLKDELATGEPCQKAEPEAGAVRNQPEQAGAEGGARRGRRREGVPLSDICFSPRDGDREPESD